MQTELQSESTRSGPEDESLGENFALRRSASGWSLLQLDPRSGRKRYPARATV